jgi:hypothetical protein
VAKKPDPAKEPEPSTGRYATVRQKTEEVVLPAGARKSTLRGTAPPATTGKRVVPRILKTNLGEAKVGPRDAYLFSCVDGVLAVEDLADLTGMPAQEVLARLEKLAAVGLVRL